MMETKVQTCIQLKGAFNTLKHFTYLNQKISTLILKYNFIYIYIYIFVRNETAFCLNILIQVTFYYGRNMKGLDNRHVYINSCNYFFQML